MGTMSNSDFFLSKKDLSTNNSSMEYNSFSSSSSSSSRHRHQEEIKKEDSQCREDTVISSRTLEVKLPCTLDEPEFSKNDEEDHHHDEQDGYTTPRSMVHKLPLIFTCPPAPRKPKSIPRKRKATGLSCRRRILIADISTESLEALFSPAVLHGLADLAGGIIKKVKNI